MSSIRRRLLQSLLIGLVLISSLTGVLVYHHVRNELDELYNAHLQQLATFMAREWEHTNLSQLAPANTPTNTHIPTNTLWEEEDYLIQLWSRDGVLLMQEIPAATKIQIPLYAAQGFYRHRIDGESWRIYRADSARTIVQIAQPEQARRTTINETSMRLLLPLSLQIPLLVLVAWISVRRGLKPLNFLSNAIAQRQPEALSAIESGNQPRELQPLVTTLNDLLARLNSAMQQQKNFVADAAHELRTPIAALQLQLDLLQRAEQPEAREKAIAQLRSGLQRATHLTQQLLSIARAEGSSENAARSDIDLASAFETILQRHLPLARERQLDLGVARLETVCIHCAAADIEAVLDNLVSNAIRYTPRGGRIDLAAYRDGANAVIEVIDSGTGIPAAERERIFDRFYRVLQQHDIDTNYVEGSGLGLAIVKTICDRYGAQIQISAGQEGSGTCFSLRWPLKSPV